MGAIIAHGRAAMRMMHDMPTDFDIFASFTALGAFRHMTYIQRGPHYYIYAAESQVSL